jgi:hypothetical protein
MDNDSEISAKHCRTAAELVDCLELSKSMWDDAGRWGWCFRGRTGISRSFQARCGDGVSWPHQSPLAFPKALREFYAVVNFMRAADRSGLAIPHDAPELRAFPFGVAFGAEFSMEVLPCWPSDQMRL